MFIGNNIFIIYTSSDIYTYNSRELKSFSSLIFAKFIELFPIHVIYVEIERHGQSNIKLNDLEKIRLNIISDLVIHCSRCSSRRNSVDETRILQ